MKRIKTEYGLKLDPFACYKMEFLHDQAKENFESTKKWIYLGASATDIGFAKVGMTMGNLTTRSSSSENPRYFLFCAFKCIDNITKTQLKAIETDALSYLESNFIREDGLSKRATHHESARLSECFYNVDFLEFFRALHSYLYETHRRWFSVCNFGSECGIDEGDFLDCEFNSQMSRSEINKHIRMILQ